MRKDGVVVAGLFFCSFFFSACSDSGSGSSPTQPAGTDQTPPADTPTTWTVVGTIEFPVGETASALKVRAVSGVLTTQVVSNVVPVTLSGNPPMANFQLDIDVSGLTLNNGTPVDLEIFNDLDGNDILGLSEGFRGLMPLDLTCAVWANGVSRAAGARFSYYVAGSYNTTLTGWYYANCSDPASCLTRVTTTNNMLTGAVLGYAVNLSPIQP